MTKRKGSGEESGFGGVFKGLADLIEKLAIWRTRERSSRKAGGSCTTGT